LREGASVECKKDIFDFMQAAAWSNDLEIEGDGF
jgi:hypothetical protein